MPTPSYRKDTVNFKFHNANPRGLLSAPDCVVRAISFASDDSWTSVYMDLARIGLEIKSMPNAKATYQKYLAELGYTKHKQPRHQNRTKLQLYEFCMIHTTGTYIISIANHMTVVHYGKIYDTWNCSHKTVGNYWEVK